MKEVTVFKTWEEPIADMTIQFLKADGINAFKVSDVPRSVLPFTMDGLGKIEIRVPEEDAERATEIIAVRFSDGKIPPSNIEDFDE